MDRLKAVADKICAQPQRPVHLWHPQRVGQIDIRIDSQGAWFHEGDPIRREEMARLFSSILWRQDGQYFLVTPTEKFLIEVEDTPFVIQQMENIDGVWVAITNMGDQFFVDQDHPVELRRYQHQQVPYIRVRHDLWGRVSRSIYYQWIAAAMDKESEDVAVLTLTSGKYKFTVAHQHEEHDATIR